MKKTNILIILLMAFSISTVVYANELSALVAKFPVFVNGEEFKSDKKIVVINGTTYVPLKAVGKALNTEVKWNSTKRRVEIGSKPSDKKDFTYMGSKNSKVFHRSDCKSVSTISPENLVGYSSRDEALKFNKRPCKSCKP